MNLPKFTAPAPIVGEMIHHHHERLVHEFERWVNDELVPAMALGAGPEQKPPPPRPQSTVAVFSRD